MTGRIIAAAIASGTVLVSQYSVYKYKMEGIKTHEKLRVKELIIKNKELDMIQHKNMLLEKYLGLKERSLKLQENKLIKDIKDTMYNRGL